MIAIVHSIYSQSVHAPASHAGLMDNEAERYCKSCWLIAYMYVVVVWQRTKSISGVATKCTGI